MKAVIFTVADKEYGVDIAQIREVIRMRRITPVPETAEFVEGVISLRCKVVPIVNLRKKLNLEVKPFSKFSRIIITQAGSHILGIVVDGVADVVTLDENIISAPDTVLKEARYLSGIAKFDKKLILIADIDKLLGKEKAKLNRVSKRVEVRKRGVI